MKIWVIMKKRQSPVFIYESEPHEVWENKKAAQERLAHLKEKATTNDYWAVPVKFVPESMSVQKEKN